MIIKSTTAAPVTVRVLEGLPPGCGHRGGGLGDLACNTVEHAAAEFPPLGIVWRKYQKIL